jgi:ABC-type bacteriocin/lantibiotic exporter with double-glycine peptidase domain
LQKSVQDKVAESQVIVEETMGISIVKAFANEWYEIARYDGKNKEVVKPIKGGKYRGYFASLSYFVFGAIVAVVWFGVRLSISGEMSGQLISFVLYSTL